MNELVERRFDDYGHVKAVRTGHLVGPHLADLFIQIRDRRSVLDAAQSLSMRYEWGTLLTEFQHRWLGKTYVLALLFPWRRLHRYIRP